MRKHMKVHSTQNKLLIEADKEQKIDRDEQRKRKTPNEEINVDEEDLNPKKK
jgi:hypothetical protein